MSKYTLSHLSDGVLERRVDRINAHGFRFTAWELAHIAEYDARRLFVPKGFPSMSSYCVGHLRLSTDAAYKRIHAGRAARQFPAIFDLIAAGRLHLCGVTELAPYLTPENAAELLEAAAHRSVMEIRVLLRERFPRPDLPTRLEVLGSDVGAPELATSQVDPSTNGHPAGACQLATSQVGASGPRVEPLSAGRYGLQLTIGQGPYDKLRYAQALLGHAVPSGDLAQVFERALDALITQLEKQKFAATTRPGRARSSVNPRCIPAHVKRVVWERDGARCTFVSDAG